MKYLILYLVWCIASLLSFIFMLIMGEYNVVYIVHFFVGLGFILTFGLFESIEKDRKRNSYWENKAEEM